MIDDVRLNVPDRRLVRPIGGVSIAESGLAYGELMDAPVIRQRILEASQ
jgi:2-oxoglutarate/2-oxoacid ferredoxin oxidoreductase subunit alpha